MSKKSKKKAAKLKKKFTSSPDIATSVEPEKASTTNKKLNAVVLPVATSAVTTVALDTLSGVAVEVIKSALGLGFQAQQPMSTPTDNDTIIYSRQWIFENKSQGVECPTCGRHVEEYRRKISPDQAFALKMMYEKHKQRFVNIGKMRIRLKVDPNGELAKLAHWRLIRQHSTISGSWSITGEGVNWITGKLAIPQSVYIYQGELTGQCIHKVYFNEVMDGKTCQHGNVSKVEGGDPYREIAKSSELMYNLQTLADRRKKIARYPDSDTDLFASVGSDLERVINPLSHDFFHGHESIRKAKEWVERQLEYKGGYCPSCDRMAAYNRNKITDSEARLLIEMYKRYRRRPVHVPRFVIGDDAVGRKGHPSASAHRGLLIALRSQGRGARSGMYRLSDEGVDWIYNRSTTIESIFSFNRFSQKIEKGKQVSVIDVFNQSDKYNYSDLMSGI